MTVHEYLQALGIKPESYIDLALMIGEVIGDSIGSKRMVYHTTPIHTINSWYNLDKIDPSKRVRSKSMDYVVLNPEVHDLNWLSGSNWNGLIDKHHMMLILAVSREELAKYYNEKQAKETEDYIGKKIMEGINDGTNPWTKIK